MDYKLNASEWRVLQALWGHAPQTLMQLVSNLQRSTDWSASTIKTLISRMTDKGVLRFEGDRGSITPRSRSRMRHIPRHSSFFRVRSAEILGYS